VAIMTLSVQIAAFYALRGRKRLAGT